LTLIFALVILTLRICRTP